MNRKISRAVLTCIFLGGLSLSSCTKTEWYDYEEEMGPITFTFYNVDTKQDMLFNDPIAKEITKRTGVTLDVKHPRATSNQDVPLMITSDTYADLIYLKGDMTKLIDVSAVISLDEWTDSKGVVHNLIEEYCPNMKKLYGDELVKLRHTDGHIYSFGTYEIKKDTLETSGNLQIQHAVLKELHYPKISNLDEYADAIKVYMAKHPTINGQPTIGLSLLTDGWNWYIDLSNPANYVIGYPDDGQWIVDKETHQAKYKFLVPEMSIYYKWLNGLYHDGILDPESFTQSEEVWKAKIKSGRVLGITYPNWGYGEERTSLVAANMPERTYAFLPITAGAEYKDPSLTDYGYSGGWGISISRSCRDVIRAVKFMDWMCSEEAQILTNWGLENKNYVFENGKRTVAKFQQNEKDTNPDYSTKTGVGRWTYPFPQCGSAAKDSKGDWMTRNIRQIIIDSYLPVEKETLSHYGATMWIDLFPQKEELNKPAHGQVWQYQLPNSVSNKVTVADDMVREKLIQCVICEPEEFNLIWKQMVDELHEIGMDSVGDEVSKLIDTKLELWKK